MNNETKKQAIDIITVGLQRGKQDVSDKFKLSIDEIENLDKSLQNTDNLKTFFNQTFFEENFQNLNKLESENSEFKITDNNFVKIQSQATLLRTIEIQLILHIAEQNKNPGSESKLDGNKIMEAFQNSEMYQQYFGENGINDKIKEFKDEFGSIPTFDQLIDINTLPNLKIEKNNFNTVSETLQKNINELDKKMEKNLKFKSFEMSEKIVNNIKMIALQTDPLVLAMANNTKQGKEIKIEIDKKSFGTKAVKFTLILSLLIATATIIGAISGIAAPAVVAALGGAALTKLAVGVSASVLGAGIGKGSAIIGKKIDKIWYKGEKTGQIEEIAEKIQNLQIKGEETEYVLNDFNKKIKAGCDFSVSKKQETKTITR